jgi:hypothetical protein
MERMHVIQQVTGSECGLQMEVHLKDSGFENVLNETRRNAGMERVRPF